MIPELEDPTNSSLKHFYNKLSSKMLNERIKIFKGSIFLTLIKMTKTRVSEILSESALPGSAFVSTDIKELIQKEFILESEDINKQQQYIITAFGLWVIEYHMKKIDVSHLIQYFQETKFGSGVSQKPLSDLEKIIITSMVALRNFSLDAPMDINDEVKREFWIEIFDKSAKYLKNKKFISKENWKSTKSGNEHQINYVMRRANDLPQKTKFIYKSLGNSSYYLDLASSNEKAKGELEFLFSILFGQLKTKTEYEEIQSFLNQLAYDYGKYVKDSFKFIDQEWDSIIEEALDNFYYDQLNYS